MASRHQPGDRRTGRAVLPDPYAGDMNERPDAPAQPDAEALDAAVTRALQHVAATLDAHMEAHGLSVRDVARACGISVGTVQAVRTGKTRLEARVLARLETGLGTTLWPRD